MWGCSPYWPRPGYHNRLLFFYFLVFLLQVTIPAHRANNSRNSMLGSWSIIYCLLNFPQNHLLPKTQDFSLHQCKSSNFLHVAFHPYRWMGDRCSLGPLIPSSRNSFQMTQSFLNCWSTKIWWYCLSSLPLLSFNLSLSYILLMNVRPGIMALCKKFSKPANFCTVFTVTFHFSTTC